MRQPQQKSRGRGRGRKQQNPLNRNYESNGPDVKIRGNASHVAEKYTSLARDALSNGDTVMAENYYQHAEHYNRIVAAAQSQHNANRAEENQNPSADGSQTDVENSKAENSQTEEAATDTVNGKARADSETVAEADSEKPRRNSRRSRKPEANGSTDTQNEAEGAVAESASEASAVEGVSEDAAKLPGSIIGDLAVEENT